MFDRNKSKLSYENTVFVKQYIQDKPNVDIQMVTCLKGLGYKVPKDFQVIGVDNLPSDLVLSPSSVKLVIKLPK